MERNSCVEVEPDELELRLGLRRCSDPPPPYSTGFDRRNGFVDLPSSDERGGQITIFYDGQVSVCTITDLQAKAIMEMAKNEMNRSMGANKNGKQEEEKESSLPGEATTVESQLLNPGLSMKRSLQRFLQKRKTRMADLSCPYGKIQKPLQLFSSSS
ncbi:protein TIFY 5A [Dendrobium catenatum]|uniref:Protein TIFY n=1 Tax=Dendrobium catenatum TaxID=906689 RepID=A0A2I0W7B8_9ASPA|nr:protein TIFY 5A [Dendrobium catenatum]PKU71559.1 Protein TIFY 5A [Dendrobium catenatum]